MLGTDNYLSELISINGLFSDFFKSKHEYCILFLKTVSMNTFR